MSWTESRATQAYDVVVVGAGIAGSACAAFLAQGGRRVALIDRRPASAAGAQWVNGVPAWTFRTAGLALPEPPERRPAGDRFVLATPSGHDRLVLPNDPDVFGLDMRRLGDRLRAAAVGAGAVVLDRTAVRRVDWLAGRLVGLETDQGRVTAPVFVDASGTAAVLRRSFGSLWPTLHPSDTCLAAQAVFGIRDEDGAGRFLETQGLKSGDSLAWTGVAGGYSVVTLDVDLDQGEVAILTGSVPDRPGIPTGAALLAQIVRAEAWIGDRRFGGAGIVPLRRPFSRLVAPGLALLGDAACQVFPGHGSGIGIGLCAARLLADALLAAPPEAGGELATLWPYAVRFHRTYGGLLAAYDLVRRLVQGFSGEDSELLLTSGLITPESARAGRAQVLPPLQGGEVLKFLQGASRAPRLAARLAGTAGRIPAVLALAKRFPDEPDERRLSRYERRLATLCGTGADSGLAA